MRGTSEAPAAAQKLTFVDWLCAGALGFHIVAKRCQETNPVESLRERVGLPVAAWDALGTELAAPPKPRRPWDSQGVGIHHGVSVDFRHCAIFLCRGRIDRACYRCKQRRVRRPPLARSVPEVADLKPEIGIVPTRSESPALSACD